MGVGLAGQDGDRDCYGQQVRNDQTQPGRGVGRPRHRRAQRQCSKDAGDLEKPALRLHGPSVACWGDQPAEHNRDKRHLGEPEQRIILPSVSSGTSAACTTAANAVVVAAEIAAEVRVARRSGCDRSEDKVATAVM